MLEKKGYNTYEGYVGFIENGEKMLFDNEGEYSDYIDEYNDKEVNKND